MCKNIKQMRLAEEAFERLTTLVAERQRNGRLASKTALPRDSVELSHVKSIAESVRVMQAKGYVVQLTQVQPDGPLTQVRITGPTNFVWTGDDLRELVSECPTYVRIEDYALVVHEQYRE